MSKELPLSKKIGAFVLDDHRKAGTTASHGDTKREISRVFRGIREESVSNRTQVHRLKSSGTA